jgi:hypothetical protein
MQQSFFFSSYPPPNQKDLRKTDLKKEVSNPTSEKTLPSSPRDERFKVLSFCVFGSQKVSKQLQTLEEAQ